MVNRFILVLLYWVISCTMAIAGKVYDFNTTCQAAYNEITSLRIDSGVKLLQQARQQNPDNLIPDMLESYVDFFVLFFNEDPAVYKLREKNFDQYLDRLKEGDEKSPFYNYSRAVVTLHKAIVAVKFGERFGAAWDFRRAFNLVKANQRKHPNFSPNKLIAGPLQVAVGTIPSGYKWLASIFGLSGSIKQGMQSIRTFMNTNDGYSKILFNEASFYYCYLCNYFENNPDEVFSYIKRNKLDLVNNHVFAYMATNLSKNNKKTDEAIDIATHRNNSGAYMKTVVWDLELGYLYLHKLEIDESIEHFTRFTSQFKGNTYVKEAYQKLSWAYFLRGNMKAAEDARKNAISKGSTSTDADRRSHNESKTGRWPHALLLKVRLLNDGGYNQQAMNLLAGKNQADFDKPEERLEFVYRAGRVYDDIGRDEEALRFYNVTIQQGRNRREYYASRAALQAGMILERQGKKAEAVRYYEDCLDMDDHEFKDSIDQRAKAGLLRCKE